MKTKLTIAPSVLSADFRRLERQIAEAEEGGADWLHLDVMDGHFVPNITFGPMVAGAIRRATKLPLDAHLMIERPERYLEAFRDAGVDRLTVHVETCPHLHRTLEQIRALGMKPGVTLNPATPLETIREVVPMVDLVLIMTVNPGFGGQKFIPASLGKIAGARQMLRAAASKAELEVDGGVDTGNIARVVRAGATVVVAGNAIFSKKNIPAAVRALRAAAARP